MESVQARRRWVLVQCVLFAFLAFALFWRGGKSIDVTWVLAGVAFFVVMVSQFTSVARRKVPLVIWAPAIGLLLWTVLSYLLSSTANYGLDEVLRTASFVLLFLWAYRFARQEEGRLLEHGLTNFARVISVVALLACVIGVVVYVFQPVDRFVGTFFDVRFHTDYWPNAWADFLLLAWPVVFYWAFAGWNTERIRSHKIAAFLLRALVMAVLAAALFLSYSRGGVIAFGGQLVLLAGMTAVHRRSLAIWLRLLVGVAIILTIGGLLFRAMNTIRSDVHQVQSVTEKVTFTSDEGASSVSERTAFWRQAFVLSWQKPLFGWGPYSFRFVQPQVQNGILATSDHPHNVFLKYAVERGWPAALLLLFLVGVVLLRGIDTEIRHGNGRLSLGTLLIVALAGVLSHSLIDYNLQFVGIALPFWLMLGFLAGHGIPPDAKVMPSWLARISEVILVCVLVFVAFVEGVYLVTSSFGRHAEELNNDRTALLWYTRSDNELFSRDLYLSKATILLKNDRYMSAERALRKYLEQNNRDARAWKLQGDIQMESQQIEQAVVSYETAYAYGKYNDVGRMAGLVRAYLANDQREELDARKDEFDRLLQLYANAIVRNTHFIALSSNVEQFIEVCELFARLYPDEAPVYIVMAARADDHATVERARLDSRPPGFLW